MPYLRSSSQWEQFFQHIQFSRFITSYKQPGCQRHDLPQASTGLIQSEGITPPGPGHNSKVLTSEFKLVRTMLQTCKLLVWTESQTAQLLLLLRNSSLWPYLTFRCTWLALINGGTLNTITNRLRSTSVAAETRFTFYMNRQVYHSHRYGYCIGRRGTVLVLRQSSNLTFLQLNILGGTFIRDGGFNRDNAVVYEFLLIALLKW